ncbi:MAG: hypothetical protein KDA36_06120 [Planctomycetaceae bacterium]|nr:hypothetical protein [Planctomycetaceae bacterium]
MSECPRGITASPDERRDHSRWRNSWGVEFGENRQKLPRWGGTEPCRQDRQIAEVQIA